MRPVTSPSPAPRVALIHATPLAIEPIRDAFTRHWPQAQCMNLLDDSLSADRTRDGQLTPAMTGRFLRLADYALDTGCQAILFTCSAFGPAIDAVAAAHAVPVLKPNEAMFGQALALAPAGRALRVGLVASFEASLPSMTPELTAMAQARGVALELRTALAQGAMEDLARGDAATHHRKVAQAAATLADCDAVMLAQFSMAAAAPDVRLAVGCPVLTSPDCAVLALHQRIPNA